MWIFYKRGFILCFLCIFSTISVSAQQEARNNGEGGSSVGGVKRKTKKIVQDVKFKNNLYDQIAQESDHDSSSSLNSNNGGNGNVNVGEYLMHSSTHDMQQYGMRLPNNGNGNKKARNPRESAEPNYVRNYHYSSNRDSQPPPGGNWRDDNNGYGNNNGGRQMSSFSLGGLPLQAAASSPNDYAFGDGDDNSVAAGGHGHQSHGHGWGGGGGGGGGGSGGGSGGKDCNSALGLLGVLGLASYLQNVLRQMSTTPMTGGRKRRSSDSNADDADFDYAQAEPKDNVTPELLPLLVSISQARDGKVPMKCALRPYCLANSVLTKRLGVMGRPVCEQLENVMESSIGGGSNLGLKPKWRKTNALRELRLAARSGVKGRNCWKLYPHCPQLERMAKNYTMFGRSTFTAFPLSF